jgi:integrase/recombinase XerC
MPQLSTWNLDPTRLLTRRELAAVLADLTPRAQQSANTQRNLVIVRLACCCGLRVSEIAALQLDDVVIGVNRPHLRLRCGATKGGRSRRVPLWWDSGTLADLAAWKTRRVKDGARGSEPFVCSMQSHRIGRRLQRHAIRRRFLSACKALGLARLRTLTIHHGRHTYISHALAGGRTLAEVRAAAGHASLLTTSVYLHVAVDDDGEVGSLFEFQR